MAKAAPPVMSTWTFLSNHAHVLLCVASDTELTIRELSDKVGITERAIQRILAELQDEGYLTKERDGRRNRYRVEAERPLRHPVEAHQSVGALIKLLGGRPRRGG